MKKVLIMFMFGLLPTMSLAQTVSIKDVDVEDGVAYASFFTSNFSFLLSIIIGLFATYFVYRSSRKMGGGLFGDVLKYVSAGMLLISLGAFALAAPILANIQWVSIIYSALLSLGFVFLVLGAEKLLKGISEK